MRRDALFEKYELFIAAATVGAHANFSDRGFRQRDVKFLIELFTNWVEHSMRFKRFTFQNTQVSRYLESLVSQGLARRSFRTKRPSYALTRAGLIELLTRIGKSEHFERPERFLFVYYFISNYSARIFAMVREAGQEFPPAIEIELRELLDVETLRLREIKSCERELEKIDIKISEAIKSSRLAVEMLANGSSDHEVARKIEELFPYELNSEKPLSKLYNELPVESRRWELEIGNLRRAEQLWIPSRALIAQYLKVLSELGQRK